MRLPHALTEETVTEASSAASGSWAMRSRSTERPESRDIDLSTAGPRFFARGSA